MSEQNFDLVVLGAGSGGYAAALRASQLGMSVGLIEKAKVGGTCLHVGCIPTKALLHSAEVADVTRESAKYGVTSTFNGIDVAAVTSYREEVVASKWKGLQGLSSKKQFATGDALVASQENGQVLIASKFTLYGINNLLSPL